MTATRHIATGFLVGLLLSGSAVLGQPSGGCGSGSDGSYSALSNTTLPGGTYNFSSFSIAPGVTVTVTGTAPLNLYVTGHVDIQGILVASGGNGGNGVTYSNAGVAGAGVAGGASGGAGVFDASTGPLDGQAGSGTGGGGAGSGWSGGGGAGFGTVGGSSSGAGGAGGAAYGTADLVPTLSGSGGGGGSGGENCGSGGGGGGGGAIVISSCGTITIGPAGAVRADGGNGGSDGSGNCGGGGGGSGGAIWLAAATLAQGGTVSAVGGGGGTSTWSADGVGATGAVGRIRFDYTNVSGTGTTTPAPFISAFQGTAEAIPTLGRVGVVLLILCLAVLGAFLAARV